MSIQLDPQTTNVPFHLAGLLQVSGRTVTKKRSASGIGDSSKATGIEIRMLPPFVKENGRNPLIGGDFAKLYVLTIVVSDLPDQTIGGIDLKGFPRIGDNEHLPINKSIYYWQSKKDEDTGPNQIHFVSRVMKSRKALRDVGSVLSNAKNDEEYKSLVQNLGKLLKNAASINL